jgi:hypothetical protein
MSLHGLTPKTVPWLACVLFFLFLISTVFAQIESGMITLTWTDNSNNETAFKIERRLGSGGFYSQIGIQSANLNFFIDSGLNPFVLYCYRVRATNASGDSPYSNESCKTPQGTAPPPKLFLLTISPVPANGFVTATGVSCGAGGTGDCSEAYSSATLVTLTGNPAGGFRVDTWTGCAPINTSQCTVLIAQAKNVAVTFSAVPIGDTPSVSINNVSLKEGNSGTRLFNFTVALSNPSSEPVTVSYNTSKGTAVSGANCEAGADYKTVSGMLTFKPEQTSKPIGVEVCGDTIPEPNKTFSVSLTSASNAMIATGKGVGVGTIVNDDSTLAAANDFDADVKSDISVYETETGNWLYMRSQLGFGQHLGFGGSNFLPVPGDYDGDGKTDTAVYDITNGSWFIAQSKAGFKIHPNFGGAGFLPVIGDYDGDGKIDVAVYEASTGHWFMVGSTSGFMSQLAFGEPGFVPVPGDYDGDGKTDAAVYDTTNGNWFIAQSTAGFKVHPRFGGSEFIPVPGDYDNDGKTDEAVYQISAGHWFYVGSATGFGNHLAFGESTYMPVPADYDGDGQTDTAVYDTVTGNWFFAQSTAGFQVHPSFGGPGFVPVLPQVTILRAMGLL